MTRGARSSKALLLLAYLAFISLGLPDAVLGVAWPSLRDTFDVSRLLLGAPLAVAAAAYFVSGLLAGRLMQRFGVGALLAASTALVTLGVFGFSAAPAFVIFLLIAPAVGFGSGAIDSALNTYAAGHFSAKHMTWLHAAYSAGAMAGPVIMTAVIARGEPWRIGYSAIAAILGLLGVAFVFTRRLWGAPPPADGPSLTNAPVDARPLPVDEVGPPVGTFAALRSRSVRLQIAIFFLYAGIEVCAGQWSFTVLTESRGFSAPVAGAWVSSYWGGLLAGRLLLGFVVERIRQVLLLRLSIVGALLFAAVFAIPGPSWTVAALPLLAFSLASIFPGLMAETPRRVGNHLAPHSVGFQVSAATAGVAAMPSVAGLASARFGLESVAVVIAAAALALLWLHEHLVRLADRAN